MENGGSPLVTVYRSGEKIYLQINNFGQRIQSKPRFPEPGENGTVSHSTQEEQKNTSPPVNGHQSGASWLLDESYVPFADMARKLWPWILDEELTEGHRFYWSKYSLEQRLTATHNLRLRVDAGEDGKFVKSMPHYLKTEWKRGPRPPDKKTGKPKQHQPSDTRYVD